MVLQGSCVLDPFAGSGRLLQACAAVGASHAVACDLSTHRVCYLQACYLLAHAEHVSHCGSHIHLIWLSAVLFSTSVCCLRLQGRCWLHVRHTHADCVYCCSQSGCVVRLHMLALCWTCTCWLCVENAHAGFVLNLHMCCQSIAESGHIMYTQTQIIGVCGKCSQGLPVKALTAVH